MRKFLLSLFLIALYGAVCGQSVLEKKLSVQKTNVSYKQMLGFLEKEAGVLFMYEDKLVQLSQTVSIQLQNKSLHEILRELFPADDITFSCVNNQIIIHKKKQTQLLTEMQKPQKNESKSNFQLVYDTVSLVVFDTLHTHITDTNIVLIYDTVYQVIEKHKPQFSFGIFPQLEHRMELYSNSNDSLVVLRTDNENVLPGFALQAIAYLNMNKFDVGVGLTYRHMLTNMHYAIKKTTTTTQTETIYIVDEYYDYVDSWRYIVTSFGDSVLQHYTDSVLVQDRIPQTVTNQSRITQSFSYAEMAHCAFVGIPISVKYSVFTKKKTKLFLEFTAEIDFKLYTIGYPTVAPESAAIAPSFSVQSIMGYVGLGAGCEYKINNRFSLVPYIKMLASPQGIYRNSTYENYRLLNTLGIGLKF